MKILVVGDNDLFARWVTVCLASAHHTVWVMTPESHGLARLSRHCRAYARCGATELRNLDSSILEGINSYGRAHQLEYIVPADLAASLLLARGRSQLRIPGVFPLSEPTVIDRLADKWQFYNLLRELGLPTPRTWQLESPVDADRGPWTFPLMLKPPRGEGPGSAIRVDGGFELPG